MEEKFRPSPYRRGFDVEAGRSAAVSDDEDESDPFDITSTKYVSVERLKRWRQAALVLNASRRFRYTLDLKKEEEKKQLIRKIRTHAQVIRAAYLFKAAGEKPVVTPSPRPPSKHAFGYGVGQDELVTMSREHETSLLQQNGGVCGLAERLKSNVEKGIRGDDDDILKRKSMFGTNTYPRKKGRSFWRFLWEAWQDLTLIILMIAAAASLALGIKTEGIEEGWYDGGSIAFAVILVIVVTGIETMQSKLG